MLLIIKEVTHGGENIFVREQFIKIHAKFGELI